MPKLIAEWNTQLKLWNKPEESLFSEHSELFLATWPTSGMTQNGQAFELPTQEHPTSVSESSLLRSPKASEGEGGALGEAIARKRGNTVGVRDQAMDLARAQGYQVSRAVDNLIGTPRTSSANGSTPKQVALGAPKARIEDQVLTGNWGKFEPAIERWESILKRPAPSPTKPDGKNDNHRLSSKFTEWMMGLPDGWVTNVGLSRNEELKACGNGVVPQQAELALSILLRDTGFIKGESNENM